MREIFGVAPGPLFNQQSSISKAARLRQETTLTIKAIAGRQPLGTSKSASVRWHQWMRKKAPAEQRQARPAP